MILGVIAVLRNLALVLVLLIGLFFLGLGLLHFRPTAGDTAAAVDIAAPPATVFAMLTDIDSTVRWIPGMQQPVNLTGGPMRVGSHYRLTVTSGAETMAMEMSVIALEPAKRLRFVLSGQGAPSVRFTETATYELEPLVSGTRLTLSGHTDYESPVTRMLEPLITALAQTQLPDTLTRLKVLIEKGTR